MSDGWLSSAALESSLGIGLSAIAGAILGALFFGGLWYTTRRAAASERPALWFLGSLLGRVGATLAGFYLVGAGHWERMLACLAGFFVIRLVATWMAAPAPAQGDVAPKEGSHAP